MKGVVAIMSIILFGLLFFVGTVYAANCQFILGFKVIHDQIPDIVGDCLENERFNPKNGNTEQRTTAHHGRGGLLVWRKSDNWTAFTDGTWTWVNGPYGLQKRLNTERFSWEEDQSRANSDKKVSKSIPCSALRYVAPAGTAEDIAALLNALARGEPPPRIPPRTLPADIVLNCTGPTFESNGYPNQWVRPNANLTRVGDNLYQDTLTRLYVHTFACSEFAYFQDAVVTSDEVIFLNTGTRCVIRRL